MQKCHLIFILFLKYLIFSSCYDGRPESTHSTCVFISFGFDKKELGFFAQPITKNV